MEGLSHIPSRHNPDPIDSRCEIGKSLVSTSSSRCVIRGSGSAVATNSDGSTDVWFAPTLPQGVPEANWAQTIPGKGWNMLFRL
jgi:hypothetical protein